MVERLRLDIRKIFLMVSIVKDCSQLPREVAKSLSLKVFKNKLDKYLSGMVYVWLIFALGRANGLHESTSSLSFL